MSEQRPLLDYQAPRRKPGWFREALPYLLFVLPLLFILLLVAIYALLSMVGRMMD